ncbi:MAG: single-stranded-DNA-specific exonuclease RecJ [Pseudomonadales bacterium]
MSKKPQLVIKRRQVDLAGVSFSNAVSPLLQRIYAARGLNTDEQLSRKLNQLPAPSTMLGMAAALELLAHAFNQQQSVLIVGDFDADGATSTTLAVLALRAMGLHQVDFLVPNRFEYGYGLTPEIVELALDNKPDLIITVDNGISSVSGVACARAAGIAVLITDHHLPGRELPDANAILNPNQHGCEFPTKNLAGVGVVFYLLSALRSYLREKGWFSQQGISEPNMVGWLDLVALGTVADVVPLDQVNRALVYQGLARIRAGQARPGIHAILELAKRQQHSLVASDLGFAVGPRLNAAGRLDDMSIGIQCLLADDPFIARQYAAQLDEFNRDRRVIESGMQREAEAVLAQLDFDEAELPWGLCLYEDGWHQGVVGLLASRIKDKVHRPVIAFADGDNGELKGSARSIPGLHIRDALDAVATSHPGLITKFGGHAMAAGLSLRTEDFPAFSQAFDEEVRRNLDEADMHAELWVDGELEEADFNLPLAEDLRNAGPWGQLFPEPLFEGDFRLVQQRLVGEKHLKLVLAVDKAGQQLVDAIAFNVDLERWPDNSCETVHVVYKLDINEWRGRQTLQLMVENLF